MPRTRRDQIGSIAQEVGNTVAESAEKARGSAQALAKAVKPHLRGWLHAGAFPIVTIASVVLVVLAPTTPARLASAVFGLTAVLLFGTSALYHRGNWSPKTARLLKRFDHSNIFLIIAGSYTPLSILLLPAGKATALLWLVWGGALLGVMFRIFWIGAPRWLYIPAYFLLGWAAVFYLPDFARRGGLTVMTLVIVGGVLYTVGGIVYAFKRPNPLPRWFGFHEIFHAFTLAAFTAHFVGISLAVFGAEAGAAIAAR